MTIFLGFAAAAFVGYDKIVAADKGGNMACPLLAKVLGGDFFFAFISAVRVCNDPTVVTGLVLSAASAFAHDFYSHSLRRGNATREGAGEGCPLKPRLESPSCRSSLRLKNGEDFSPRDLYYYANELKDHAYFKKAIKYYCKFLSTKKGWIEDDIRAYINMAECYRILGNLIKEKESLVMSFIYDVPRPEVSCRLGDIYKENKEFNKAIVWYRLALEKESINNQGFRQEAYSTWYPHLQLCVCYWETGEKKLAVEHNNCAKVYRPNDSSVKTNEKFFENYFKNRDM